MMMIAFVLIVICAGGLVALSAYGMTVYDWEARSEWIKQLEVDCPPESCAFTVEPPGLIGYIVAAVEDIGARIL